MAGLWARSARNKLGGGFGGGLFSKHPNSAETWIRVFSGSGTFSKEKKKYGLKNNFLKNNSMYDIVMQRRSYITIKNFDWKSYEFFFLVWKKCFCPKVKWPIFKTPEFGRNLDSGDSGFGHFFEKKKEVWIKKYFFKK